MSSTYSPDLRIELIGAGDQAGNWGSTTNTNLGTLIEQAIAGYTSISVTSANQAFTVNNGAEDQARAAMIALSTTTVAAFAVYAPPVSKQYIIYNTSATHTATIYNSTVSGNTTAAGLGIAIPPLKKVQVFSEGTNFYAVDAASLTSTLPIASGGTGQTTYTAAFNALAPIQQTGATINTITNIISGNQYSILSIGSTDFTLLGASTNAIGVIFTANSATPSGSGTVTNIPTIGKYLSSTGSTAYWASPDAGGGVSVVSAGSFVIGNTYTIYQLAVGGATTDFTLIGAASSTPGVAFVATGVGTGTGTATTSVNGNGKILLSSGSVAASFTTPVINGAMFEAATITATAGGPTATTNYDVLTQTVQYYTSNSTVNFILNIRGNATTTLNSSMAIGQAMTLALLITNVATAAYPSLVYIDGTPVTVKWQNAITPTSGFTNSVNVYVFTIVKTASATYTVLGSQTQFA